MNEIIMLLCVVNIIGSIIIYKLKNKETIKDTLTYLLVSGDKQGFEDYSIHIKNKQIIKYKNELLKLSNYEILEPEDGEIKDLLDKMKDYKTKKDL